ncbi:MAG: hypothetical protein GXP49_07675 [Deltaproteobacteria bacterium]|nr:hypothetical protein [Deltaproteobacteria bacterium]
MASNKGASRKTGKPGRKKNAKAALKVKAKKSSSPSKGAKDKSESAVKRKRQVSKKAEKAQPPGEGIKKEKSAKGNDPKDNSEQIKAIVEARDENVIAIAAYLEKIGRADNVALLEAMEELKLSTLEGLAAAGEAMELIRNRAKYDYLFSAAGGPELTEKNNDNENLDIMWSRLMVHRALAGDDSAGALALQKNMPGGIKGILSDILSKRDWIEEYPDRAKNTVSYLAARYSLPHWLAAEMLAQHGLMKAELIGKGSFSEHVQALAVNLARTNQQELRSLLSKENVEAEPGRYFEHTLVALPDVDLRSTTSYEQGLFEIVDPVEQLICQVSMARQPSDVILWKAVQNSALDASLACRLAGAGKLTVLVSDPGESLDVKKRARRLGSLMVRAIEVKTDTPLDKERIGRAGVVIVEVPSSNTGNIYNDPLAPWRLASDDLPAIEDRQARLLEEASKLVAPRGRLVYVTRSVLYAENQAVAASFMDSNPRFNRVPVRHLGRSLGEFETQEDFLQVLPGQSDMPGVFVAVLEQEW